MNFREAGRNLKSSVKSSVSRDRDRQTEDKQPINFSSETEVFSYDKHMNNRDDITLKEKFIAAIVEFVEESGRTDRIQEEMEEMVTSESLALYADCFKFMLEASKLILETREDTVRVEIDYKFSNVIDDVVKNRKFKNFNIVFVRRPILTENFIIEIIRKK